MKKCSCSSIILCDGCRSEIQLKDFAAILSDRLKEEILPRYLENLGRNGFNTGWLIWIVPKLQIRKIDSISLDELLTKHGEFMSKTLTCSLPIFRCTRNEPYREDVSGYIKTSDRQGHYIQAPNATEAIAKMYALFPEDAYSFTIEYWEGRAEPQKPLAWLGNTANPKRLDVVRQMIHLLPGETPEKAMERYLIWIADGIVAEPQPCNEKSSEQLEKEGFVGVYTGETI